MFRKITTFTLTNNKKILFLVLFFFSYTLTICQSNKYDSYTLDKSKLKRLYVKIFQEPASPQELQQLWNNHYPRNNDTLIYLAKLNPQSENPILNFYYQTQESLIWSLLGIIMLNATLILVITPMINYKKTFYTILLIINLGVFYYYKAYYLLQEWVFLPSNSTVYEINSFAARSEIEFTTPQIGLVINKKDFWYKIETENGTFWIPEINVIK